MSFLRNTFIMLTLSVLASCMTSPGNAAVSRGGQATGEAPEKVQSSPEETQRQTIENPPATGEWIDLLAEYESLSAPKETAVRVFPQEVKVHILNEKELQELLPLRREKDTAWYSTSAGALLLRAPGYQSQIVEIPNEGPLEVKLERAIGLMGKIGDVATEYQPKSVRFSPDGASVFTAHLGATTAMSQYSVEPLEWLRNLDVPQEYRGDMGFVETLILEDSREIWLSQMNRNVIHVFDLDSGSHRQVIELSGVWPKVLLASSDEKKVYVSCWLSDMVSEIDIPTRRELRSFKTSGTPRGMALTPDGKELLVAIFSSSGVDRINLETGSRVTHDAAPGRAFAMRHIVHDPKRREYYITAMGVRRVYRLSEKGEWLGYWTVGDKPNTAAITPEGDRLFVSCRGPNNPDTGYLTKGYEFGKVFIINLNSGEVEDWFWGRDQTTGLDVSPNGDLLAFTDFLSGTLELYKILR